MQLFKDFKLSPLIQNNLDVLNFTNPTPIQAQTIPLALEGSDILGSAQTGTGKTLAFSVPLVSHILNNSTQSALVLTPTRELAQQVFKTICTLIPRSERIAASLLIGGESFTKQLSQLRRNPRIIVATPGRMIDHLEQGTIDPVNFSFLVLDEMDRMFDMGFSGQIETIIKMLPKERQTLMFSATVAPEIEGMTKKYLHEPKRISIDTPSKPVNLITQETINLKETEKYDRLLNELSEQEGSVIVFVKTKRSAEILAENLDRDGHEAECIHGDLRQNKRERVMTAFRKGRYRIMVATDVAARGLDVPHIKLVVNYDLPQCPEDYIHRIGRTGRAGAEGSAINFVAGHDKNNWEAIERLINPEKFKNLPKFKPQNNSFGSRRSSQKSFSHNKKSKDFRSSSRGNKFSSRDDRRSDDRFEKSSNNRRSYNENYSNFEDKNNRSNTTRNNRNKNFSIFNNDSKFNDSNERSKSRSSFDKKRKPFDSTKNKNIRSKSY